MKNVIAYFILAFVFISCNIKNEEAVEATVVAIPEGSLNVDTGTIVQADTLSSNSQTIKKSKLLLIARGSEPGWYAEFFEDHLRLLIDNGTDSLTIENDFLRINDDKDYYEIDIVQKKNEKYKKTELSILITGKSCTESGSGEKRERSISIDYNSKTYKGCATSKIN